MSDHRARVKTAFENNSPEQAHAYLPYRLAALAFRIIALLFVIFGILRISKILSAEPVWNSFLFYTVQSNLLCLIWLILLVVRTLRDLAKTGPRGPSVPSPRLAAAVMMAITVTLLIYVLVLAPSDFVQSGDYVPFSLTDSLIHVVAPALIIADWLLFVPKGCIRGYDPALWLLLPLAYVVFALTAGALGAEFFAGVNYPYPFMDVTQHGYPGVGLNVLVMGLALLAVGYLVLLIDRLLARAFRRKS
ncbi:Pr6Pr family membrane protein [Glutamicibacter sp.]|jgi:hypothetical protein|uniref:Pr6Pr family membrane protein n=1 Tax=Glutamicibacter sp. TaxID=1931995 RepID=UPI002B492EC8|nr:Pr6Pr family membrane protein [Glutamicibacter sp.]HJX80180.1 Pr6Pr family membrane protein [Glutamicibacter sp.]